MSKNFAFLSESWLSDGKKSMSRSKMWLKKFQRILLVALRHRTETVENKRSAACADIDEKRPLLTSVKLSSLSRLLSFSQNTQSESAEAEPTTGEEAKENRNRGDISSFHFIRHIRTASAPGKEPTKKSQKKASFGLFHPSHLFFAADRPHRIIVATAG